MKTVKPFHHSSIRWTDTSNRKFTVRRMQTYCLECWRNTRVTYVLGDFWIVLLTRLRAPPCLHLSRGGAARGSVQGPCPRCVFFPLVGTRQCVGRMSGHQIMWRQRAGYDWEVQSRSIPFSFFFNIISYTCR